MTIMTVPAVAPAVDERRMAHAIRILTMDAVERAKSGHPGMPMGMADVATVLFSRFLKFDPADPAWPDRDRFILSAGHGSMLLYSLLYLTGYPGMTLAELQQFRQWGALTAGHPEYRHTPGVETTTGPLGQGIATAVGMALAERLLAARYGAALVDHYTYVLAGDGCLMEGISQEALSLAGHLRLNKLIVLFDDNRISIDGSTDLSCSDDQRARFAASGWAVAQVDGHDQAAVAEAIAAARQADRPSLIACRTVIGWGAPNRQGSEKVHGAPLGAAEIAAARAALDWPEAPFAVPAPILEAWRSVGARGAAARADWQARVQALPPADRRRFRADLDGAVPETAAAALAAIRARFLADQPKIASRQASQQVLDALAPAMANLLGGSADLTHSNLTKGQGQRSVTPDDFTGSYLHFGIREHAMAAALNGIALHGGFIPYGGTFLVFADYARPAIRLSALMGIRVIYVLTHDSIGLGEDGPTHQPVETIASLRLIPHLHVFRPADAVETAEAWAVALSLADSPSALCLSRQALASLPRGPAAGSVADGAWVVFEPVASRDVTVIASGSEVGLALTAAERLAGEGIAAAVVSAPCLELFARQPCDRQAKVLGDAPRIVIEAAVEGTWGRLLGPDGVFIGMTGFGASAPAEVLYDKFGITSDAVVEAARRLTGRN